MDLTFYTSIDGRCRRQDYWLRYVLPFVVGSFIAGIIDAFLGLQPVVVSIFSLAALWPFIAVGVRRCHDRDYSGWMLLISLIPVIGWLWALIDLGFIAGTTGSNRFGPDPKSRKR